MTHPRSSSTLAQRVCDAAFSPHLSTSEQLADALAMAAGLAELLGDHADWADFHGDDFPPPSVRHAARGIQAFTAMAAALADALAEERNCLAAQLAAALEEEA
jgi:hypothetical protein